MLELDSAELRFHGSADLELPEEARTITLNRDRVLLLVPLEEPESELDAGGHPVAVKIICRGFQLTGLVRVPVSATITSFMHESRNRFLPVARARISGDFEAEHPLCLVNRSYVVACIETGARGPADGLAQTSPIPELS
jgi:hypothetical protein